MQINNLFFTAGGGNTAVSQWPQVALPYVTRYGGSAVNSAAGGLVDRGWPAIMSIQMENLEMFEYDNGKLSELGSYWVEWRNPP